MNRSKSDQLFATSQTLFPGGVNSPVRAFGSVDGDPVFLEKGEACHVWDADGNKYIDFCCSWGPLILGHRNQEVMDTVVEALGKGTSFGAPSEYENKLGQLILDNHSYIEMIRFVNSGTEAAMSALRLARGVTGRDKIIKFEGCYHGHVDSLLVKAGSGLVTLGNGTSAGVPESFAKETIVVPLNNKEAIEEAVTKYKGEIACIAIEPIPANNGLLLQDKDFLLFLREICDRENILLFFDEVISGFRVGFEGAAGLYGVQPDMIAFGKVIGGGFPVGAFGASKKVMEHLAPLGGVYQAGTLSGNPVAMAAGYAQLKQLSHPSFYDDLANKTQDFVHQITSHIDAKGYDFGVQSIGSIFWLKFSTDQIKSADEIDSDRAASFRKMHPMLLNNGIYMGPSAYEVGFISAAHTPEVLTHAATIFCNILDEIFS